MKNCDASTPTATSPLGEITARLREQKAREAQGAKKANVASNRKVISGVFAMVLGFLLSYFAVNTGVGTETMRVGMFCASIALLIISSVAIFLGLSQRR